MIGTWVESSTRMGMRVGTAMPSSVDLPNGTALHPAHRLVEGQRVGHRPDLRGLQERVVCRRLAQDPAPAHQAPVLADEGAVLQQSATLGGGERTGERQQGGDADGDDQHHEAGEHHLQRHEG